MITFRRYFLMLALVLPFTAIAQQPKADEMKGMDMGKKAADTAQKVHTAHGMVKKVDANAGTVLLDHQPINSLSWPAMTMSFKVSEKSLLDKLGPGRQVEVSFSQVGKDYVITAVK